MIIRSVINCRDNYGSRFTGLLFTLCHRQNNMYDHRMIEELTAKIRPCKRKKMQFILIGKLDNISIKLVA